TGSGETAARIRSHRAIANDSVRVNIEADSLNCALLLPGENAGSLGFDLLVREVVREMTIKSGQKCTAIPRVPGPASELEAAADAIGTKLAGVAVGNPRNERVRMGSLVSREQLDVVTAGIARLAAEADVIYDGRGHLLLDAEPAVAACIGPTLLAA